MNSRMNITDGCGLYGGGLYNKYAGTVDVSNCTFADNDANNNGGGIFNFGFGPSSTYKIANCIIWDNEAVNDGNEIYNSTDPNTDPNISYCDIKDCNGSGANWDDNLGNDDGGNFDDDPLFANPANDDFHLKSASGRWNGTDWANDAVTSPCVNGGAPSLNCASEPSPNGDRINIGAYGNTAQASKSSKYHLVVYLATDDDESLSADMQWQLVGLDSVWRDSAEAVLADSGNYTIKCQCNSGTYYISADDLPITISEGQPISYARTYKACGYLTVQGKYVDTSACSYLYASWNANDGQGWRTAGQDKLVLDTYTISFGYVGSDHAIPDPVSNVVVSKGSSETINRTYGYLERYVDRTIGNDNDLGTRVCRLDTIQEAFDQIPNNGSIFVDNPATYYESITFPTSKNVTIFGRYATTIIVSGYHRPSQPPSNITVYDIEFTRP